MCPTPTPAGLPDEFEFPPADELEVLSAESVFHGPPPSPERIRAANKAAQEAAARWVEEGW